MKVVILCGGKGTRIGDLTRGLIPKPMVEIGGMPIIEHIMQYYSTYNHNEFILCAGHLSEIIKNHFSRLAEREKDVFFDLTNPTLSEAKGKIIGIGNTHPWKITIAETGKDSMTAGRVKRILKYLTEEDDFFLTYGDGLSNVNLDLLLQFHKKHGRGLTLTGVIPPGRFGELIIDGDQVTEWAEKPQQTDRYINGGYMVMRRKFAEKYIAPLSDDVMLEGQPFEQAAKNGEMMLFRHDGFWQCMDTMRDWEHLNSLWKNGASPWIK